MDSNIAIKVSGVSKTFRIPHEKISSIRGAAINAFKKSSYEEFKALDDVSFEVKKGEFFGIIGRNGSGKSTLLKILAGIYQPDAGKVHPVKSAKGGAKQFHGVKINGMISPFLELGIGFNPELSGRDNVYLNATVLGMTKKQIDAKFDDIVKFSELERFIDQKLKNYSSGMQVRLAFSVSIHANRDILLMDEVLAVGDSNFQSKCLEEFNKYREMGRTVIIVTHDISVVQRYCDRAMLLRSGKIKEIGKADEVADKYIFDNISDEEDRMSHDVDKKGERKRDKSKVAEITKVEFLDKDGNEKNVFETGDDMSIRVYFKQNKSVEKLNFGLAIFNQENDCMSGISTVIDKDINVEKYESKGYFEVYLKKIPFKSSSYYVNIAIFGDNHAKVYNFSQKVGTFKIFSRSGNDGLIELDYRWG